MLAFLGPRSLTRVLDGIKDPSARWECRKSEDRINNYKVYIKQDQLYLRMEEDDDVSERTVLSGRIPIMIRCTREWIVVCCSDTSQLQLDWYAATERRIRPMKLEEILQRYRIPTYSSLMEGHLQPSHSTRFKRWIFGLVRRR